jgi:WD40 repeat protein
MKKCPFCAEDIQDAAIKCKHCGSMLDGLGVAGDASGGSSSADVTQRPDSNVLFSLDATLKGHPDEVLSVAFSPDGAKILTCGKDSAMMLWDTRGRRRIATVDADDATVSHAHFSPTGGKILSIGGKTRVWDANTLKPCLTLKKSSSGDLDEEEDEDDSDDYDDHYCAAFSPGERYVVTGDSDGLIKLWTLADGDCFRKFRGHKDEIYVVSFLPGSKRLVSAGEDATIRVWDTKEATCLLAAPSRTSKNRKEGIYCGVLVNQGAALLTSFESSIALWELATGRRTMTFPELPEAVTAIAVPQDETIAVVACDESICLLDLQTCACVQILKDEGCTVNSVAVSPDGQWLASGGTDGLVKLWGRRAGTTAQPG